MNEIKLKSRYKDVNTCYTPINEYSGLITSNGHYIRYIYSEDNSNIKAIDFDGGPIVSVGDYIKGVDKKVKSIKVCYYIELE